MEYFMITVKMSIVILVFMSSVGIMKCEILSTKNEIDKVQNSFLQRLSDMKKMFDQKLNSLSEKVTDLEKTVSQLKGQGQLNRGLHGWNNFNTKRGSPPPVDCTVDDDKTLNTKPVCDYGKCDDWSSWGSCDINTQQQSRNRQCRSKYMILCKPKTETDTKFCGKLCELTNCTDWSLWSQCHITSLGENGLTSRRRTCITNNEKCLIDKRTETETKTCKPDCMLDQCNAWSDWSPCDISHIQEKHTKKRARKCGIDSESCVSKSESQIATCNNSCPDKYIQTSYGTCLKCFFKHETWYDAEKVCQIEGGHLMSLDNRNKSDEVRSLFSDLWTGFWMDGQISAKGGNWLFRGGNSDYQQWGAGEPRLVSNREMCVYVDHRAWQWRSFNCQSRGHFMCERTTMK